MNNSILYESPIFGPVWSRRLGLSLGINLLPADGKICSFDCIYCECGLNKHRRPYLRMPFREEVSEKLRQTLIQMRMKNAIPDVLTFAGNGEPTLHPDFENIINDAIEIRNKYAPKAKISVLSNAAHLCNTSVFRALLRVDNALLKLDTVDSALFRLMNRPNIKCDLLDIIEKLKAFNGRCIVQTMFLKGSFGGIIIDNTTDRYVLPWIEALKTIRPKLVTIYTIDTDTPILSLQQTTRSELERIANLLTEAKIAFSVSY